MSYLTLRLLSSFLSGVILSQTGSLIQTGTRNILAGPSTLGVEGLSVLWILSLHSLLLFAGLQSAWGVYSGIVVLAFAGYVLSRLAGRDFQIERVLFVGLTFNLLVGAVFSLWQFFFMAYNLPFPMEIWFGNFRFTSLPAVITLAVFEAILLFTGKKFWNELELYSLGPAVAKAHRVDVRKLHALFFILSFTGTFLVISFFGAFSFLGLLFPLLARRLWFKSFDLKGEFLPGAVTNGLVFMLFDFICYQYPIMGAEIPVGLIASVMGALCLITVIVKGRTPHFLANTKK